MSNRPFMQFYFSDFLGDTMLLNTEQIGAYMLLIAAMWNAGGELPNDEAKLARATRLSLKKWRAISDDVLAFFEVDPASITHKRVASELQKVEAKSQSRSIAGAKGAAAKALKSNKVGQANAVGLLKHLPEPEPEKEEIAKAISKKAPTKIANRPSRLSADWLLPEDWRQDAVTAGLAADLIDREAAKMRDWSVNSAKGAKVDWRAAWRNWCREAADRQKLARGSPPKQPTLSAAFGQLARSLEPNHDEAHHPEPARIAVLDVPFRPGR